MTTRSEIIVREAEEDDLDRVVGVLRAANVEFETLLSPAFYRAYLANVLDVRSRLDESQLFVASEGDRIVGAITLYPDASKEGLAVAIRLDGNPDRCGGAVCAWARDRASARPALHRALAGARSECASACTRRTSRRPRS